MKNALLVILFIPLLSDALYCQQLQYLSSYYTDVFDEGAAETAAFDAAAARLFFTNANANTLGILDISDPNAPALVQEIDLSPYGAGVNSVDVANELVAVAIENDDKQSPGIVVFFNTNGDYLNEVSVGVLPDMLTFSHDGSKVLVANEGEPNDDYTVDPEGSVSIIDVSGGVASVTVQTVSFAAYNGQKASLINKGVRIFGPNATVAQDLEPEYITLTADDARAYVSLQENNAMAVIDVNEASLLDIYSLGVKDHQSGSPELEQALVNEIPGWPALGKPDYHGGQPVINLGGFSGLYFDPVESDDDTYVFYTVPDRGPHAPAVPQENVVGFGSVEPAPSDLRPFKLPEYQARIVKLSMDVMSGAVTLEDSIMLRRFNPETQDTIAISGRGVGLDLDETPVTYRDTSTAYRSSDWIDTVNNVIYSELPGDAFGGDLEGIVRDRDGNFWLCDEYRPSLYKIQPNGVLIQRYVPVEPASQSEFAVFFPKGIFGVEVLPKVYNKRRVNRGFEAIAYDSDSHIIYAFLQSPLDNPDASVRNNSDVIRILGVDADSGTPVSEHVYLLERNRLPGLGLSQVDKIGDAVYAGNGRFFVIERDSSTPDDGNTGKKYVYEINLQGATDMLGTALSGKTSSSGPEDKTLEMMSADDLAAAGIQPVHKTKVLNLPSIGYLPNDKPEGLALLPGAAMGVINDNDFGAGNSDDIALGIISFGDDYAMDASDQDGEIRITPRPVLGMRMADAITGFSIDGQSFIATANEGDAREYRGSPGFVEEADVADLLLDPDDFEDVVNLQLDANLGRLTVTTSAGDLDGDGLNDELYSFGARSFSIYDEFGNLVFDSGDDFEQITAQDYPDFFNADNDSDSFDNRSDNKGPEPEAVTIADINGSTMALVGLERIGGIMIYNIDDPGAPQFMQYINNRNFGAPIESREVGDLGVEDIVFIPAADSPIGLPLVVTANEVSGTVSIFTFGDPTDVEEVAGVENRWRLYPNPVGEMLLTNTISDYAVFSTTGQLLRQAFNTNRIELDQLPAGTYLLRDIARNRAKLFVKQ